MTKNLFPLGKTELGFHEEQAFCTRLKVYAEGTRTRSAVFLVASPILAVLGVIAYSSNLLAGLIAFALAIAMAGLAIYYKRLSLKLDDEVIESSSKASVIREHLEVVEGVRKYAGNHPTAYTPPQYGNPPRR